MTCLLFPTSHQRLSPLVVVQESGVGLVSTHDTKIALGKDMKLEDDQ
jgi:hypothetical protein